MKNYKEKWILFGHNCNDPTLRIMWKNKVKMLVAQSCPTLCNPVDCSPPGSSVHGIHQARVLGWVAVPFSRGSFWIRGQTQVSCSAYRLFTIWTIREIPKQIFCVYTVLALAKNTIDWVLLNNRNVFFTALEAGSPRSRCQQVKFHLKPLLLAYGERPPHRVLTQPCPCT